MLDQTGVDGGQEDWDVYNLVVVGSNDYAAFVLANIDDLILFHGPLMVCNSAVAAHMLMGTAAAQSTSDTNEFCETIANRVMQLVFGATVSRCYLIRPRYQTGLICLTQTSPNKS